MSLSKSIKEVAVGLFRPSGVSVVSAIVTALLCSIFYLLFATADNVVALAPWLVGADGDEDVYITSKVLTLDAQLGQPSAVYLVGNSSIRDAIDTESMRDLLHEYQLNVVDLTSSGQSILEALAIVDNLPSYASGIVVLGHSLRILRVTPAILANAQSGSRRGFSSRLVDQFLEENGFKVSKKFGIYGIDNFRFVLPRLLQLAFNISSEPGTLRRRLSEKKLDSKTMARTEADYRSTLVFPYTEYFRGLQLGRNVLLNIKHQVVEKRRMQFLLIEAPLNPGTIKRVVGSKYYYEYKEDISGFCRAHDINYFDAVSAAKLNLDDFKDLVHVYSKPGIRRYTRVVAEKLFEIQNAQNPETH